MGDMPYQISKLYTNYNLEILILMQNRIADVIDEYNRIANKQSYEQSDRIRDFLSAGKRPVNKVNKQC